MTKVRRAGYVFITRVSDHAPRHVHVVRDGHLVLKWNLEARVPMTGTATSRLVRLIEELEREGRL
jgi:hypothetical protein